MFLREGTALVWNQGGTKAVKTKQLLTCFSGAERYPDTWTAHWPWLPFVCKGPHTLPCCGQERETLKYPIKKGSELMPLQNYEMHWGASVGLGRQRRINNTIYLWEVRTTDLPSLMILKAQFQRKRRALGSIPVVGSSYILKRREHCLCHRWWIIILAPSSLLEKPADSNTPGDTRSYWAHHT